MAQLGRTPAPSRQGYAFQVQVWLLVNITTMKGTLKLAHRRSVVADWDWIESGLATEIFEKAQTASVYIFHGFVLNNDQNI